MLKETGRIVDIKEDALWVETIKRSTCGSCVAEKGCGQTLLQKIGVQPSYMRIPLKEDAQYSYQLNDSVTIGIPNDIVVKGSLLLYLVPLIFLLVFSGVVHTYQYSDALVILAGLFGFFSSCLLIRWYSYLHRNDERYQAFLVEDELTQTIHIN